MAEESPNPVKVKGGQRREKLLKPKGVMNRSHLGRSSDLPGGTQPAPGNPTGMDRKKLYTDLSSLPAGSPLDQTHWKPRGNRTS